MKNDLKVMGKYFYGNEISSYGQENKRVDYRTLAKAFDAVLSNDIITKTNGQIGYWEPYSGSECYYETESGKAYYSDSEIDERIDELNEQLDELDEENNSELCENIKEEIDELERAKDDPYYYDVFQYYIISENGAQILADWTNEIVMYNEELDLYVWCVTHWGTAWDYVLTDIPCCVGDNDDE